MKILQTEKLNKFTNAQEADRKLLAFKTWEEYLDSFIEAHDVQNLLSLRVARKITGFGFKSHGDTLSKEEFYSKRQAALDIFIKERRLKIYNNVMGDEPGTYNPLMVALATREEWNRTGIVHSIIFLRHFTKDGYEISGYIDYADRLQIEDWEPFFLCKKRLWPKPSDLGFYHWRHGTVRSNLTRNYKPLIDLSKGGLLFQNRNDLKIINPNPEILRTHGPGENTTKQSIRTRKYAQIEIYDHTVRKKQ